MQAHFVLAKHGLSRVYSFGTGTQVRLPHKDPYRQNVFQFGTPYRDILKALQGDAIDFYRGLGIEAMLERNIKLKTAPQRFQDSDLSPVDIVVTFEERVFDQAVDHLMASRGTRPVHCINLDVKDNHEESQRSADVLWRLVERIEAMDDVDEGIQDAIDDFERETGRPVLHSVQFI